MEGTDGAGRGSARLDGLLNLAFPPDPDRERRIRDVLSRIRDAIPVRWNERVEPGHLSLMPEADPVPFPPGAPPSRILLPLIRDLTAEAGEDRRVESSLRIQEYLGDAVTEGVFVEERGEISFRARERPARPGEIPTLPEPSVTERAESLLRRHPWPFLLLGAALLVVGWFGWQAGWWRLGAGSATGPAIDAGPLDRVVTFEKARWAQKTILIDLRPGPEFERFAAVAAKCGLRPGVFRVLLRKEGKLRGTILPLDLSGLPAKLKKRDGEKALTVRIPCPESSFDEVLICR